MASFKVPKPPLFNYSQRSWSNSLLVCVIKKDQVSFVPRCQAGDAICCVLQLLNFTHWCPLETMLLSLDINKAFDTLSWSYYRSTLIYFWPLLFVMDSNLIRLPLSEAQILWFWIFYFSNSQGHSSRLPPFITSIHFGSRAIGRSYPKPCRCQGHWSSGILP